jgi:hypothetical protein
LLRSEQSRLSSVSRAFTEHLPPVTTVVTTKTVNAPWKPAIQGQIWALKEKVKVAEKDRQLAQEQVQAEHHLQSFHPPTPANNACDDSDKAMQVVGDSRGKERGSRAPAASDDEYDEVRPKAATAKC